MHGALQHKEATAVRERDGRVRVEGLGAVAEEVGKVREGGDAHRAAAGGKDEGALVPPRRSHPLVAAAHRAAAKRLRRLGQRRDAWNGQRRPAAVAARLVTTITATARRNASHLARRRG